MSLVYYCELLGHVWLYIKQLLNCTISRKYNGLLNAPRLSRRRDLHTVKSGGARADARKYFSCLRNTKKIAVRSSYGIPWSWSAKLLNVSLCLVTHNKKAKEHNLDGIRTHDPRFLRRRSYLLSLTEVRSSAGCSHTNQGKDLNLISSTLSVSYTHYSIALLF